MDKGGTWRGKLAHLIALPSLKVTVSHTQSPICEGITTLSLLTTLSTLSWEFCIRYILPMKCAISKDNCLPVFSLGRNLELSCEEANFSWCQTL